MNDWRTKFAVLATVLGLGALGGYAMSANRKADQTTTASSVPPTKVVRRTVHVKPKPPRHPRAAASGPPAALTSRPVSSGSSGSTYSSAPVSTHTSGGGGGAPVSTHTSGGGGGEHESGDRGGGGGD